MGCGNGFFTNTLARQLKTGSEIYAVDKQSNLSLAHKDVTLHFQKANFEKDNLIVPSLNGILMANSLHFVEDKKTLIKKLVKHLTKNGKFILVEYDTDTANPWVPYPICYTKLISLFSDLGFTTIEKMAETKSLYRSGMIYSAVIEKS